jgi:imidazolonepropionase-like amidohydrolase
MKKPLIIILPLLILAFYIDSYGQQLSKGLNDFVSIQDSAVAITNVTLIDGTGSPIKLNQDILFIANRISAIEPSGKISIPENTKIIDGTGKTVIPGLIMLHEHLFHAKPFDGAYKAVHMTNTFPKMYLAGGVTTMRTAGGIEANTDLNIKNSIGQGKTLGPNIDVSTPHVEREGFIPQIQSLYGNENIENWINYWLDKGVTSVKVYNHITQDDLSRIIKAAHARNIKVTGHLCSITYREAASLGIDNLEHGFMAATDFVDQKEKDNCVNGNQSLLLLDECNSDIYSKCF